MPSRLRLRDRLMQWLGGGSRQSSTSAMPDVLQPAVRGGPQGTLALPAPDAAQQAMLAGRYFAHAEELLQRGAADLAAPYFRQAYALLQTSQGGPSASVRATGVTTVVDLSTHAPATSPAAMQPRQISPPTTTTNAPEALPTLEALRQQLTAENASTIASQVKALRQQGVNHPDLEHLDGLTLLLQGQRSAAAERFRVTLSQAPNHYRSLVNLAGIVLAEGRLEEAQSLLLKSLEQVNPDGIEALPALTNLSLVHQAAGRQMDEALLVLKIHRLKPGHLRAARLNRAAEVLEDMGEEASAVELLEWLHKNACDNNILQRLATLLERRGDYQAAALAYRQLLQPQPTNEGAHKST